MITKIPITVSKKLCRRLLRTVLRSCRFLKINHKMLERCFTMLIPFDVLFPKYRIKSATVVHLGANTGQEAESYARHGVKRVIWVEAIPAVAALLCDHVARFPGSEAICACLSD